MIKSFMSLVAVVMLGSTVLVAQNVEQGKKFFYYKRYKSAREALEKVLAANPNDIEATYWLGQTLIEQKDSIAAKNLYQKLLQQNGNAPLILAGMGQIELMEGKTNDARQRFESAISLTKGKDIDVFNAIGRANVEARYGDANYAIEKLNQATQVKRFNDPTTYLIMGDAYRKQVDGGNAVTNYEKAFSIDPTLAAAKYNIGKIYLTQQNYSYFTKYMNDAIAADANYAPAYYDMYVYFYERDVNEAKENLAKYASIIEPDEDLKYDQVSIEYASRNFQGAIDQSKAAIARLGDKATPRYYKLIGYSYAELKDTANAKSYMDQYFARQKAEDFVPKDYTFYAQLLARTPGSEAKAFEQYDKAIALDTVKTSKLKLMDEAAKLATKIGSQDTAAIWYKKIYYSDTAASNRDLYNWGYAELLGENYDSAYAVFKLYQQKYPDEIYGYLWGSRAAQGIDTAFEQGLAAQEYELFTTNATRIDSVKYKSQIIYGYKLLAQYQVNIKKDTDSALVYVDKVLAISPDDADAKKIKDILLKVKKQAAQRNSTGGTSSSKGTKSGGTSASKK